MFLENSGVSDRQKQNVINSVSNAQSRKESWKHLIPEIGLHEVGPSAESSKSRLFNSP